MLHIDFEEVAGYLKVPPGQVTRSYHKLCQLLRGKPHMTIVEVELRCLREEQLVSGGEGVDEKDGHERQKQMKLRCWTKTMGL